jgi:molecular chaperone DnaK
MNLNSSESKTVIGIDLGTTMSAVSFLSSDGVVETIPSRSGGYLTPSTLLIGENQIYVGQEALDKANQFPNLFAECFKRNIGQAHYPIKIKDYSIPPEVLCALLIESMKEDAEAYLGKPINEAVITVPAFYGSRRRQSTRLAGELAGLTILDVVNEPTAAALAYGYDEKLFLGTGNSERIMVYDLGGGTFDVSLLQFRDNRFVTLATDGNVQLGGRDFDAAIKDFVADKFIEAYGVDPRADSRAQLELFTKAKQAKHELSERKSAVIDCHYSGMRLNVEITRQQFEEMIGHLIELTMHTCRLVLQSQKLTWKDIDYILMVGGSSRIPMLADMLTAESGKAPRKNVNPDELVARGAALFAASKMPDRNLDIEIVNVNSHSLGIAGVDTATNEKINKILIPRNTPLPAKVVRNFVTNRDNQAGVSITLLEGENQNPKYCEIVARSSIVLEKDTPSGSDIEVICSYKEDGTIHVSARVTKDRKSTSLQVKREAVQEMDSLGIWKARLLNQEAEKSDSTSTIPNLDVIRFDAANPKSAYPALDYQCQEIGKIAYVSTVTPQLIPIRRAVQQAIDELKFFERVIQKTEKRLSRKETDGREKHFEGILYRAKTELKNAEKYAQHCRIVLGRECLANSFCPPGANKFFDEATKILARL